VYRTFFRAVNESMVVNSVTHQCYNIDTSATQLALFVAPPPDASPLPAAVLTIFPDGHQDAMFDHILLSALVIVRGLAAPL
jgi:hypothetical protein